MSTPPCSDLVVDVKALESSSTGCKLTWRDISYYTSTDEKAKKIISDCSGQVKPGEVVAILGPSGSGKTTVLNVLAGRLPSGRVFGTVLANGAPRDDNWKYIAAYVEQQEALYPVMTVKETILFAALLRLSPSISLPEKLARVESVIATLGLRHCADTYIGDDTIKGISGGERKRVAIAVEIISDPEVVFIDEPTSGLDSFTAINVVTKIQDLAKTAGRTVLMTIHQPRRKILDLFDRIILLTQGQVVFFGTPMEAVEYFKSLGHECPYLENPTDYFLDLITVDPRTPELTEASTKRIEEFARIWKEKSQNTICDVESDHANAGRFRMASFIDQLGCLSVRFLKVKIRTPKDTIIIGVQMIGFAVYFSDYLFVLLFSGSLNAIHIFVILVFQLTTSCLSYIQAYSAEKKILRRERCVSTFSSLACFLAKLLTSVFPFHASLLLLSSAYIYFRTGLSHGLLGYLAFFSSLLILNTTLISFALAVSAFFDTILLCVYSGSFALLYFMIFSGIIFNTTRKWMGLFLLNYISPTYYFFTFVTDVFNLQTETIGDLSAIPSFIGQIIALVFYSVVAWLALKYSIRPNLKLKTYQQ